MTEDDISRITQNIKKIRLEKKLSQEALADKADIDPCYYAKIEQGKSKPSDDMIKKILDALDVDHLDGSKI
jgi:transcriptional regulator with XRE-family HTH domain